MVVFWALLANYLLEGKQKFSIELFVLVRLPFVSNVAGDEN